MRGSHKVMGRHITYPKIIFMDLEGTLLKKAIYLDNGKVPPSAWTLLAANLGPDALREEEETKDRWLRGDYGSYIGWMRDTIRIHKRYGLTADTFAQVMDTVEEMPGAREAVSLFHQRGIVTAIISGGFKALADRIQRNLKIGHALTGCEYFFSPDTGLLEHWNLLPTDYEVKVDFMRLLMREYKVRKEECVFVGDGQNDIWMAKEVGLSIAFNAHPDLKRVCTYVIDQPLGQEDFRAVAACIDSHVASQPSRQSKLSRSRSKG